MMNELEQIRAGINFVDFAGRYTKLKRSGKQFVGLCPLHTEKTPSFFVRPAEGKYKCFGCRANGDIFDFVQAVERIDFGHAKDLLAREAGVALARWTKEQRQDFGRRMKAAEVDARKLVEWRIDTLEGLRFQRNHLLGIYHRAKQFIIEHDVDDCEHRGDLRFEAALAVAWSYWPKITELDEQIDRLQNASYRDLLARFGIRGAAA
jgi:hypothetical protein